MNGKNERDGNDVKDAFPDPVQEGEIFALEYLAGIINCSCIVSFRI